MTHKSVVIIGGGPVGLTTAIGLARFGHEVVILDAILAGASASAKTLLNAATNDGKMLALSFASCKLLQKIGAWDNTCVTEINQVHLSHSGFGVATIRAEDINLPYLGYTIKYVDLCAKLAAEAKKYPNIEVKNSTVHEVIPFNDYATIVHGDEHKPDYLTASLAILAEGGKIKLPQISYRQYDYKQVAIVASVKTYNNCFDIAYERFDKNGALVLLPHKNYYTIIWTKDAKDARLLDDKSNLISELNKVKFMQRFGYFYTSENVYSFPLKLRVASKRVVGRVVLLGSSAQSVHPVSAQGLNLGFRDVSNLIKILTTTNNGKLNMDDLVSYDRVRQNDAMFVATFTNFLAQKLHENNFFVRNMRSLAMIGLSSCTPVQKILTRSLIFGI